MLTLGLDWLEGWEQKRHPRVEGGGGRGGQSDLRRFNRSQCARLQCGMGVSVSRLPSKHGMDGWAEGKEELRRVGRRGHQGRPRREGRNGGDSATSHGQWARRPKQGQSGVVPTASGLQRRPQDARIMCLFSGWAPAYSGRWPILGAF